MRFPRRRLDTKLAVLLLRSAYEVADELDFVAMDKFQSTQWKRRAAEQELYLKTLLPLRPVQGDLSDPLYYDFMVFVSSVVTGELMQRGEQVFTELTGADGESRTVRRASEYSDNKTLPEAYARLVGDLIFTRLRDGFEDQAFNGPMECPRGEWACIVAGVQSMLDCFQTGGFALSLRITDADETARKLRIHVEGSATLYALAEVASRKASPPPAFVEYALLAFLRASGWNASTTMRLSRTGYDLDVELVK